MPRDAFQDTAYSTKSKPWVFIVQRALKEKKKIDPGSQTFGDKNYF